MDIEDIRRKLDEELDALRATRDELRVQLHLGAAEVRDKWEEIERAWQRAETELEQLADDSKESLENVGAAAKLLVDEIREGYRHLREHV